MRLSLPVALLVLALPARAADPIKLWPGKAAGETKDIGGEKYPETKKGQLDVKRLSNVSEPTITIYSPPKDKNVGVAVVVTLGGGTTSSPSSTKVPTCASGSTSSASPPCCSSTACRAAKRRCRKTSRWFRTRSCAITLVRGKAKELGVDPAKVGMLGFSAGGNLTAWAALTKKRLYEKVDAADEGSHLPNFCILVYPAYLTDKDGKLKPEFVVDKALAADVLRALVGRPGHERRQRGALPGARKRTTSPSELHLYASGGHGYGMKKIPHPCASWPDRAADWMKSRGLLDVTKS